MYTSNIFLTKRFLYSNTGSGVYDISVGKNQFVKMYCQMSSISGCSGGGWTMVMKIDGSHVSLHFENL